MKHSRSDAETEIRDELVSFIRAQLPKARIVHEMNVLNSRADLAAILPDLLLLFEIKSERDKLDRVQSQMRDFSRCGHHAILVAHEKWFEQREAPNGELRTIWPHDDLPGPNRGDIWIYPRPASGYRFKWRLDGSWSLPSEPHRYPLWFLDLLWRDELLELCNLNRIAMPSGVRRSGVIRALAWQLTGRDICRGVCAALRARSFAEADPAIYSEGFGSLTAVDLFDQERKIADPEISA